MVPGSIPHPSTFKHNYEMILYIVAIANRDARLRTQRALTVILDGWTDVSGNGISGFVLLYGVCSNKNLIV